MNSFDDLLKREGDKYPTWQEVRESRLKERKYPFINLPNETILEKIKRLPYLIKDFWWHRPSHRIKFKKERMQKGWSEYDWWGFDSYIARMISEVCIEFRDKGHGYPNQFDEKNDPLPEALAVTKWNTILTEISDGFRNYSNETITSSDPQFKRAVELFSEWLPAMWD